MLDMAMQEFFFTLITNMLKEVMPGANFECTFSICSFGEESYTSIINTYYSNFEILFDDGSDATDYIKIVPQLSSLNIPDPEAEFDIDAETPMIPVDVIPLEIGAECYISVREEKVRDWLENYEELGNINFRMESIYPMEL